LQTNQEPHAHFKTPKGQGVVDIDGGPSHGKNSNLDNLNKILKKHLRLNGFKIPGFGIPFLNPCLMNPLLPGCSAEVNQCPTSV
jgi:hypothetical protein